MSTTRIAAGVEVISQNGNTFLNLNGLVIALPVSHEVAVERAARMKADGHQCRFGADPLAYVKGAAPVNQQINP